MKKFLAVLIAVMLVLTVFAGCGSLKTDYSATAIKIEEQEFTVADVNFLYVSNFISIYNNLLYTCYSYGIDINMLIDTTKPLDEQTCLYDESITWHQYILDYTIDGIRVITGIYNEAIANGFVLPEEYQADLDSLGQQLEEAAGTMSKEEFIVQNYGEGVTEDTIRKMTEIQLYCSAYVEYYQNNIEVSNDDIKAYCEANKKDVDMITMRYFFTPEFSDEEGSEYTSEQAKAAADAVAAAQSAEEFDALAYEHSDDEQKKLYDEGASTVMMGITYSGVGIEEVATWLFDEARVAGEIMIYDDTEYSNSYLVVMFEDRIDPDYDYVDIRHILIAPEEDEEGNISEEAWLAAETKANEIYQGYLAGETTEEAFGELAKEHSADGNAAQGGIYENVKIGQMVVPFNDWCFDEARQPGDSGIVKTQFGYHIMYFVGPGESNLITTIKPIIINEKLDTWLAEFGLNGEEERTDAFEKVGGNIDELFAAFNEDSSTDTESSSSTVIVVLIGVIIVCIIIIAKKGKGENKADSEEDDSDDENDDDDSDEDDDSDDEDVEDDLEATEEELTEEELLAEEAFEEGVSEEEAAEETEEKTEE